MFSTGPAAAATDATPSDVSGSDATTSDAAAAAATGHGSADRRELPNAELPDAEPRWLTPQERLAWLALTGIMVKLPAVLDGQLQRDSGLTFFEYMVLAMLSEAGDQRLRMTQLSILTGGSLSRLSHVAKRLEKEGYLRRISDPNDRRSTVAILTPQGLAKVVGSAPGHVAAVRRLVIDALTAQQIRQLSEIGDAIMARIDPEGTVRPPA